MGNIGRAPRIAWAIRTAAGRTRVGQSDTSTATVPDCIGTTKASDGYVFTSPVSQFKPNAFGLYDMHGNACQWCADWYDEDYYGKSPADDPNGPAMGIWRVLRGGSWAFAPSSARSASRYERTPGGRCDKWGFRVARSQ